MPLSLTKYTERGSCSWLNYVPAHTYTQQLQHLIYSPLTVPKGDCNIKYDCPFPQHTTQDAVHMWGKFTKPVSFSLVRVYFSPRTWDQLNSLSVRLSFFPPCFAACLVASVNYMFLNKPVLEQSKYRYWLYPQRHCH